MTRMGMSVKQLPTIIVGDLFLLVPAHPSIKWLCVWVINTPITVGLACPAAYYSIHKIFLNTRVAELGKVMTITILGNNMSF